LQTKGRCRIGRKPSASSRPSGAAPGGSGSRRTGKRSERSSWRLLGYESDSAGCLLTATSQAIGKHLSGRIVGAGVAPEFMLARTIINGRHDRVVPVANGEFLDERLPNSRVVLIDAGHFVWEEAPTEYAAIILDSITANAS
jgi:pimeloyl-ACP methyl ester carboxylesterase